MEASESGPGRCDVCIKRSRSQVQEHASWLPVQAVEARYISHLSLHMYHTNSRALAGLAYDILAALGGTSRLSDNMKIEPCLVLVC